MSDLASLFQNNPMGAAFQVGQNNAQARQSEALKQQELEQLIQQRTQQAQQEQQMNPLKLQQQQIANQQGLAQIPGMQGTSMLQQATGQKAQATLGSDIDTHISDNDAKKLANQAKKLDTIGQKMLSLGPVLENVPDSLGQRHSYLKNSLSNMGLSDNDPQAQQLLGMLANIPGQKLPQVITSMGEKMIEQSSSYKEKMDTEKAGNASRERVAAGNNAATLGAARIGADSRLNVAQTKASQASQLDSLAKSKNYAGAAAVAQYMAMSEEDPNKKQQLQQYASLMASQDLASKQAGATATGKIDAAGLSGLPQAPTNNPMAVGQGAPTAPVLSESTASGAIGVQAKTAFGSYEPDKYEYGINPATGKFARKPKSKGQ